MDDDEEDDEDDDDTASTFFFSRHLLFESLQFWQVLNKGRVEQQFRKDSSNLTALQLVHCLVSFDIVAIDSMILVEGAISLSPFQKNEYTTTKPKAKQIDYIITKNKQTPKEVLDYIQSKINRTLSCVS